MMIFIIIWFNIQFAAKLQKKNDSDNFHNRKLSLFTAFNKNLFKCSLFLQFLGNYRHGTILGADVCTYVHTYMMCLGYRFA